MNDKEKIRQQLLKQTFKKKRNMNLVSQDFDYAIKDISISHLDDDLLKIHQEIKKDFDLTVDNHNTIQESKEEILNHLKERWYNHPFIDYFYSFIKKANMMDKNEYSILFYQYKKINGFIEDVVNTLNQCNDLKTNQISYLNFTNYSQKVEIFYQDIYQCLYDESSVVVFDHIEHMPIYLLNHMIQLIKDKKILLSNRYVLQKNILKETNNMLVTNALSSLSWQNKYIIFLSYESLDYLSDKFGQAFINAIDVKQEYQSLNEEDDKKMINNKIEEFYDKIKKKWKISMSGSFYEYLKRHHLDINVIFDDILKVIIDLKENNDVINLCIKDENDCLYVEYHNQFIPLLKEDKSSLNEIEEEINQLIGLKEVKTYLKSLTQYYQTYQKRKLSGKKVAEISKHMIFTGNPGTGKTTVARLIAKYLKTSGIIESGQLIEVSRKDLVGQYVGHTAILTNQVIQSAIGGVLFIDEAYSLYRGSQDSYGLEAIDTLVKAMEDHRDHLVVILAGYQKEMDDFFSSNSGLQSRFSHCLHFDDYNGEQLYDLALSFAKKRDYVIDENAKEHLIDYFDKKNKQEGGNGRLVRNCIEKAMMNHSLKEDDDILTLDDFMEEI